MASAAVLVIGRSGQLARALAARSARSDLDYICLGRPDIELAEPRSIVEAIRRTAPRLVINTAAYTQVDRAEEESDLAEAINARGPEFLARACDEAGLPLVHISTDYVFDGSSSTPYRPDDPVAPIGVYGRSKAAGEAAIRNVLSRHIIVRTAWLYDAAGRNFLTTMLRLGRERDSLSIVDDQRGSPTFADDLAGHLDRIAAIIINDRENAHYGTFHLTNAGCTTWFGFAGAIFQAAATFGYRAPNLVPIPSSAYMTAARRPAFSVLDCRSTAIAYGINPRHWKDALADCISTTFSDDTGWTGVN